MPLSEIINIYCESHTKIWKCNVWESEVSVGIATFGTYTNHFDVKGLA